MQQPWTAGMAPTHHLEQIAQVYYLLHEKQRASMWQMRMGKLLQRREQKPHMGGCWGHRTTYYHSCYMQKGEEQRKNNYASNTFHHLYDNIHLFSMQHW